MMWEEARQQTVGQLGEREARCGLDDSHFALRQLRFTSRAHSNKKASEADTKTLAV